MGGEMIWICMVFAFAIYWPSLHGDFLFDDLPGIQANKKIWTGDWRRFRWHQWRVIPQLSMALQVLVHGPVREGESIPQTLLFSLHSFNVILHALTACVAGSIVGIANPEMALVAALLWVSMPVAVSAVAYMSSRATLFATLFSLAALWCVLYDWPILALPLVALAVSSKEDHALLPFSLAGAALTVNRPEWAALFSLSPFVAAYFGRDRLKRHLAVSHSPHLVDAGIPQPIPSDARRLTTVTELLIRFPQWVCGLALCISPAFEKPKAQRIAAAGVIAGFLIALVMIEPSSRLPLWLIVTSPLPLYAVFTSVRDTVMDYRAYSAMIGPLLLAPVIPFALLMVLIAGWAIHSAYRAFDWRNPMALWKGAVRDGGGPVAWINLGAAHQMKREFKEAQNCYAECLSRYPSTGAALLNLGLIEGMEGRPESARDKVEECVRLNPRYKPAWGILAQIYEFLKDGPNAERCRKKHQELTV